MSATSSLPAPCKVARCTAAVQAADDAVGRHTACFDLNLAPADGEPGEVEYVPTDLTDCQQDKLPEYLRDSLICECALRRPPRLVLRLL